MLSGRDNQLHHVPILKRRNVALSQPVDSQLIARIAIVNLARYGCMKVRESVATSHSSRLASREQVTSLLLLVPSMAFLGVVHQGWEWLHNKVHGWNTADP